MTTRGAAALVVCALVAYGVLSGARRGSRGADERGVRVALRPIPALATGARVEVTASGASVVSVRYGHDAHYGNEIARIPMPASGRLVTTIIGLAPNATTHADIVVQRQGEKPWRSGDLTVTTPPLEPSIPGSLEIAENRASPSDGAVLLSMNPSDGSRGLALLVDRAGRILWYRAARRGVSAIDRLPSGRFVQYDAELQAFEEIELDGTVVHTWRDPNTASGTDGHDFRLLPNGNALVFGAETHPVDTRPLFPGGIEHATRWDDNVSEVTAGGSVLWRWSSNGHVSEAEIIPDDADPSARFDPRDYEVVHANSIEPTSDSGVVLSFRNTSSIVKIDRATGNIVWRLGGKQSDFRIENDPLGGFSKQHDARFVDGRETSILLFDNGNRHTPPESRVVEYRLDYERKTATLVWQWRRSPPLFANVGGSVERLSNGRTLVSFGPRGVVSDVGADGSTVWELKAPGGVYRARAITTLYH